MTELGAPGTGDDQLPLATARAPRTVSLFWLIPLVAAAVGGWLAWQAYSTRGPEITIVFTRGEGIEAGKTAVRYKDVEVGRVTAMHIAPDLKTIEVRARIGLDFAPHLTENTRFWVVRPRVGAQGVSGLSTLVSGAYIEVDPAAGAPAAHFTALETPPIVTSDAPGRSFVLRAAELGNVQPGSPLTFKDIEVGEVLGYELAADGADVFIHVFVREPHTALVREDSRFWLASGVRVSLGATGLDLRTASLQEVLLGGIKFDAPNGAESAQAPEGAVFALFESVDAVADAGYTEQVRYLLYFDESVRGLARGAPVEFRGIKLGEVASVGLEVERAELNPRIPVVVRLQPQRLGAASKAEPAEVEAIIAGLVARGLRARLQTANLLTGQLYVDLTLDPDSPADLVPSARKLPQIPTLPTELGEFKDNVNALIAELRRFPLDRIGAKAVAALDGVARLTADPAIARALDSASDSFAAVGAAARGFEQQLAPLRADIAGALGTFDEHSPLYQRLHETLRQIDHAARALRQLGETLERRPEAVIWGKEGAADD